MSYLVDTDWVVDYLKGLPEAVSLLANLTSTYPAVSIITYGEIYEGIYYGTDTEQVERGFLAFLNDFDVLTLETEMMKRFASIRGELRRSGQIISDTDILIASTALHYNLTLVSRNRRHFGRIRGLRLLDGSGPH